MRRFKCCIFDKKYEDRVNINAVKYYLVVLIIGLTSCDKKQSNLQLLERESFETSLDGMKIELLTLKNSQGMVTQITNYGARLVSIWVKDKNGNFADVCLGLKSAEDYLKAASQSYGAVMGPYAGRIAHGKFVLDGDTVLLADGKGTHVLHGGSAGFNTKVWDVIEISDQRVTMEYQTADGAGGFPGNSVVRVQYVLSENNALIIEYSARSDKNTVINLTNHAFFNLAGEDGGSVEDQLLMINANNFLPINKESIPLGEIRTVADSPMDFRIAKKIGMGINADDEQIRFGNGYDHTWVLNGENEKLRKAARLYDQKSGRVMDVLTTEPSVQFYTANFLSGKDVGKHGNSLNRRESLCLETQHFPDSPNQPHFPSTSLKAGDVFKSKTIYKFSVKQ